MHDINKNATLMLLFFIFQKSLNNLLFIIIIACTFQRKKIKNAFNFIEICLQIKHTLKVHNITLPTI